MSYHGAPQPSLLVVISLGGELELLIAQPQHDVPADQPQTTRSEAPGECELIYVYVPRLYIVMCNL